MDSIRDDAVAKMRADLESRPKVPLYQAIAVKLAWKPPVDTPFVDQRHRELRAFAQMLPSGAGWDEGTKIDPESGPNRIVLVGSYHHMNDMGSYMGWTDHSIIVTPSLAHRFELKITGKDRNEIKDYLHEMFDYALRQEVSEWPLKAEEYVGLKTDGEGGAR